MLLLIAAIFSAFSMGLLFYVFIDSLFGQYAIEERKIRNRIANMLRYKRQTILRISNLASITNIDKLFSQSELLNKLDELLKLTNFPYGVFPFIFLDVLLAATTSLFFCLFLRNFQTAVVIFLAVAVGPIGFLIWNKRRYMRQFVTVFPHALGMMKSAVQAGQGLQSALKIVSEEGPYPVSSELARVIREIDLGSNMLEALSSLTQRINSIELRLFSTGVRVQTEIGGNLSDLLEHIAQAIRDRIALGRELKALTSQAKASSTVLCALPFVIFFAVRTMQPEFFDPMLASELGRILMAGAFIWMCIGIVVITKITRPAVMS